MRVRLKGVHRVRKRLADGTLRTYHYAWRGGPRLSGELGSPEFVTSYQQAHESRRRPLEGTLKAVLVEYAGGAEFGRLSDSSKREYRRYLVKIEAAFGTMPLAALSDPRVRGEFKQWRFRVQPM